MPFFSRLSPIPSFPNYTGPYTVGTLDVEVPASTFNSPPPDGRHASTPQHPLTSPNPSLTTIAYRLYYPCAPLPPKTHSKPVHWISNPQYETLAGYARFLGVSAPVSQFFSYLPQQLYHIKIPAIKNAALLSPPAQSKKWPLLIFSHGLGGSRQAYSHLCGSLASQGMIVAAADHRDGSKPNAFITNPENPKETREVPYRPLPHSSSPETFRGRDEQLSIRFWELTCILESLSRINAGASVQNLLRANATTSADPLSTFKDTVELTPSSVSLSGHSFGASTALAFYKRVFYSDPSAPQGASLGGTLWTPPPSSAAARIFNKPTTPLFLLDLWGLPLDSPENAGLHAQPLPWYLSGTSQPQPGQEQTPTTLSILSSSFHAWTTNLRSVCHTLSPPPPSSQHLPATTRQAQPYIFYPLKSAHLSQSDFGLLFPRLTKWLAKAEEPARILDLNIRAITEVLRRRHVLPPPAPGTEFGEGDEAEEDDGFTLVESATSEAEESKKGDWRILDRSGKGKVRGWVSVDVDEVLGDKSGRRSSRRDVRTDTTAEREPALGGEELAQRE